MAFPDYGFQWLRDRVGVRAECFASPLNCWNERFCSVARDTDRFFGSMGNFFSFDLSQTVSRLSAEHGSFEANPPFVESVMNDMAKRIQTILTTVQSIPLSFTVIVPAWTDCEGIELMTNTVFCRPHSGYRLVLPKKQHTYRPGMQHRTQHDEQPSNVDTFVFFLQNAKGSEPILFSVSFFTGCTWLIIL